MLNELLLLLLLLVVLSNHDVAFYAINANVYIDIQRERKKKKKKTNTLCILSSFSLIFIAFEVISLCKRNFFHFFLLLLFVFLFSHSTTIMSAQSMFIKLYHEEKICDAYLLFSLFFFSFLSS